MTEKNKGICTRLDQSTGEREMWIDEKYPVAKGLTAGNYASLKGSGQDVILPVKTGIAIDKAPDCHNAPPKSGRTFVMLPTKGMTFAAPQ